MTELEIQSFIQNAGSSRAKSKVEEFQLYQDFEEMAGLNNTHTPWMKKRENGWLYCQFMIADCKNEKFWYNSFIGVEYLGVLKTWPGQQMKEVKTAKLFKTKIVVGRCVPLEDIILL